MSKDKNQLRHEETIDFLNGFEQYKGNLTKVEKELTFDKIKSINTNDINHSVVVLSYVLNLPGGQTGDVNLYQLLQVYFQVPAY